MTKTGMATLLGLNLFFACLVTGCGAQSDANKVAALVPAPLARSSDVSEIFERVERLLDSNDDPTHNVSRKRCREILAQAKARYGDTKDNAAMFQKQMADIDAAKLEPEAKENAYGMILFQMSEAGLAPEAVRKAEAHSSPTIRAIAPYILGRLQFLAEQYEDARQSFMRSLTMLKTAPDSQSKTNIVIAIITLASLNDSMSDVPLFAEGCVSKNDKLWGDFFSSTFADVWCKVHKDDLAAGNFELFLKRAETEADDRAQAEYVRAVIKEQMKRGQFADVPKTIDRIFPPGAEKKKVAADAAAIFGRFDGRDLCLETWAIGCVQHGKTREATTVADSIEELKRRNAAINKMIGVLIGKDVKSPVLYGLLPDTILGGDTPDDTISTPQYSEAEILEFCRWYAATTEQQPYTQMKIQRTASAAGLMLQFGFREEAEKLFDQAFDEVMATKVVTGMSDSRIFAVEPIINHRINAGDFDAVFDLLENKFPENGINIPVFQKIPWLCAMGKFDDAIALAENEKRHDFWSQIGRSLIAADRKEDAKKVFEKALATETAFPDETLARNLLQVGMTDEAFRYIERFPNAETRASSLTSISMSQRLEGNTAEADKTLLKAIKEVEKMDATTDGNRHIRLEVILSALATDVKQIQRLLEQRE